MNSAREAGRPAASRWTSSHRGSPPRAALTASGENPRIPEMRALSLHLVGLLSVLSVASVVPVAAERRSQRQQTMKSDDDAAPSLRVWPLPKTEECTVGGTAASLAVDWTFSPSVDSARPVVRSALSRYRPILGGGTPAGALTHVKVLVTSDSAALSSNTSYGYTLFTSNSTVEIVAETDYGVGYALETLSQILVANECTAFHVVDAPQFVHRGLMIDTGRRFYPVALVKRILEGMSFLKMNVLHLHLSEQCFRVQSKVFPQLSSAPCVVSATNDTNNEVYSQADIRDLVTYANVRGVRLVPEFDTPGHSGGFCNNLKSAGIVCCGNQIMDDAAGKSVAIMGKLFTEMASLFPDEQMHIGCDETGAAPPCTLANTKQFEIKMIQKLLALGKQPAGWEEVLFTTQAALGFPSVVVHSWHHHHWEEVAELGHRAVFSNLEPFYLGYPSYAKLWIDLTMGVMNATKVAGLLGGEVSAWSDEYLGSCMFSSENDALFANSTSSYLFPRTVVAAGSFWRWDRRVNASSPAFEAAFATMETTLRARGVHTCPCTTLATNGCDENSMCGEPYCSTGQNWTCGDYGNGTVDDTPWQCHTARTGLSGTHALVTDFTIPCTSLDHCLQVALWRCNVTFAARGCNAFSMANSIDPKGGRGALASFFSKLPPDTALPSSSTNNVWTRKCDGGVPHSTQSL